MRNIIDCKFISDKLITNFSRFLFLIISGCVANFFCSYYWKFFNNQVEIFSIDRGNQIRNPGTARVSGLSDKRQRVVERLVVARRNQEARNDSDWNPRWQTV